MSADKKAENEKAGKPGENKNAVSEKKAIKGDKSGNGSQNNDFVKFVNAKFGEYRAEFKKIIWLSRKELTKRTVTVIITSSMFGVLIFGMDSIFTVLTRYFFSFVGK